MIYLVEAKLLHHKVILVHLQTHGLHNLENLNRKLMLKGFIIFF